MVHEVPNVAERGQTLPANRQDRIQAANTSPTCRTDNSPGTTAQGGIFCPCRNLEPDYRKQLVREELESYHADIMCVQEVDAERAYEAYLAPLMRRAGACGGRVV